MNRWCLFLLESKHKKKHQCLIEFFYLSLLLINFNLLRDISKIFVFINISTDCTVSIKKIFFLFNCFTTCKIYCKMLRCCWFSTYYSCVDYDPLWKSPWGIDQKKKTKINEVTVTSFVLKPAGIFPILFDLLKDRLEFYWEVLHCCFIFSAEIYTEQATSPKPQF